ncbi:unnamed protein product [Clonostachys rosea f. rosea IK726]|uniref:Uncharacterized protein n=2 Tax=Bionectria ochroleuca TaxID=29856 RepID=A0A8H7NBZ5_BIOOC|nr:unnamed protein product [Clonostachys rosea f. rosea IK726]
MRFSFAQHISGALAMEGTSPTAVSYMGDLYVFWVGSYAGGIYCAKRSSSDSKWGAVYALQGLISGIAVAEGTSPCATVYRDKLYLFYNGRGRDGTFYAQCTRSGWEPKVTALIDHVPSKQMGFDENSSPAATVHNGKLHIFWSGSGRDGIYWFTLQDNTWNYQSPISGRVSVAPNSSPCACTWGKNLCLFYNGSGKDGTYYFTYDGSQSKPWNDPITVRAKMTGGMATADGTSPSFVSTDYGRPRLFWVGSGGHMQGLWSSEAVGDGWERQDHFANEVGRNDLGEKTSPAATTLDVLDAEQKVVERIPFVFWAANGRRNGSAPILPIYFATT